MNERPADETRVPDLVETLVRAAGARKEPPADAYSDVLAAATAALRAKVQRRRQRRAMGWALAASAVLAAVLFMGWRLPGSGNAMVAQLERSIGSVEVSAQDGEWQVAAADAHAFTQGSRIRTGAGARAGIVLAGGSSLRLAENTALAFEAPARLLLAEGTIYVDTGAGRHAGLEVITPGGTVRNLGTQFELRAAGGSLRLSVREGKVEVDRAGLRVVGVAGEQLTIDSLGRVQRGSIARDADMWRWAEDVSPAPDFDGRPASELLAWAARQTGLELRYASETARRHAEAAVLRGNIRHLAPLDALAVMLATTDLDYVLAGDGTLEVRSKDVR